MGTWMLNLTIAILRRRANKRHGSASDIEARIDALQRMKAKLRQCAARFDCASCRCVLDAGHDGGHDVHCQGRPTT